MESVPLNVLVPQAQDITLTNGTVIFPNFLIVTSSGNISVSSGSYDAQTKILRIFSGTLTNGNIISRISNGVFTFTPGSVLIADVVTPEYIYDTYERYILDDQHLPLNVRNEVLKFIQYDGSGKTLTLAPTNTKYYNSIIRGLLSFFLAQPEYTLLRGASLPTTVDTSEQRMIENSTGKIIFIELYGGNDYLSSIIPKDEYDTYKEYRTYGTGSSAITGT